MTIISTTYGLGGYDPEHPDANITEQVVANPDGTVSVTKDGATVVHSNDAVTARVAEQLAAQALDANASTLRSRAQRALNTNATFLALASPTNAQTLAQVRNLTRETSALIRLLLNQVDDITGT